MPVCRLAAPVCARFLPAGCQRPKVVTSACRPKQAQMLSRELQTTIQKLIRFLQPVSPGTIPTNIIGGLFQLVVASWDEFSGSAETENGGSKNLAGRRSEGRHLEPAVFVFYYRAPWNDRAGSTRAEKQLWKLNLDSRTADHQQIGFRQLRPRAPRVDVRGPADEVSKAVQEGPSSTSRLVSNGVVVWKNDDELTVFHGRIIGGNYQQTVSGRRRRFIADLKPKLKIFGWEFISVDRGLRFKKTK